MTADALPKHGLGEETHLPCRRRRDDDCFMVVDPARRRRTGLKEMASNVCRKRKQQTFRALLGYNLRNSN